MKILAIDPGNEQSAWVIYDTEECRPIEKGKDENNRIRAEILDGTALMSHDVAVIEMVACYGMAVGKEVFETVFWIGRFYETIARISLEPARMFRLEVKQHLCHDSRAKDSNIRQALIDRYGGKDAAIGRKHSPGPLYGISADVWSALAIAVTYADKNSGVLA